MLLFRGGPAGLGAGPAVVNTAGVAATSYGYAVAGAGDVNGDGAPDVVVGALSYNNPEQDEGAVLLYLWTLRHTVGVDSRRWGRPIVTQSRLRDCPISGERAFNLDPRSWHGGCFGGSRHPDGDTTLDEELTMSLRISLASVFALLAAAGCGEEPLVDASPACIDYVEAREACLGAAYAATGDADLEPVDAAEECSSFEALDPEQAREADQLHGCFAQGFADAACEAPEEVAALVVILTAGCSSF